jgi:hypothetical protein
VELSQVLVAERPPLAAGAGSRPAVGPGALPPPARSIFFVDSYT